MSQLQPVFEQKAVGSVNYRDCKAFVDGLRIKGLAPGTTHLLVDMDDGTPLFDLIRNEKI